MYFSGLLFGLSFSFIKPKKLGELSISSEKLKIEIDNTKIIPLSQIREIALDYHGYGSWWTHSLHGSKNRFYFETINGQRFDFEIVLQNKQKKHELKSFLKSVSDRINYQVDSKSNFSF